MSFLHLPRVLFKAKGNCNPNLKSSQLKMRSFCNKILNINIPHRGNYYLQPNLSFQDGAISNAAFSMFWTNKAQDTLETKDPKLFKQLPINFS